MPLALAGQSFRTRASASRASVCPFGIITRASSRQRRPAVSSMRSSARRMPASAGRRQRQASSRASQRPPYPAVYHCYCCSRVYISTLAQPPAPPPSRCASSRCSLQDSAATSSVGIVCGGWGVQYSTNFGANWTGSPTGISVSDCTTARTLGYGTAGFVVIGALGEHCARTPRTAAARAPLVAAITGRRAGTGAAVERDRALAIDWKERELAKLQRQRFADSTIFALFTHLLYLFARRALACPNRPRQQSRLRHLDRRRRDLDRLRHDERLDGGARLRRLSLADGVVPLGGRLLVLHRRLLHRPAHQVVRRAFSARVR